MFHCSVSLILWPSLPQAFDWSQFAYCKCLPWGSLRTKLKYKTFHCDMWVVPTVNSLVPSSGSTQTTTWRKQQRADGDSSMSVQPFISHTVQQRSLASSTNPTWAQRVCWLSADSLGFDCLSFTTTISSCNTRKLDGVLAGSISRFSAPDLSRSFGEKFKAARQNPEQKAWVWG